MEKEPDFAYNNDTARLQFKLKGLSYVDIEPNLDKLCKYLQSELKTHYIEDSKQMRLSKKVGRNSRGGIYLYVNSFYFKRRECISFNPDGFIGFAGWASTHNVNPILKAFVNWCNYVRELKVIDIVYSM